jgi:hypothetical protein
MTEDGSRRIGVDLFNQGAYPECEPHLRAAVEAHPEWADGHHALGVSLFHMGRYGEAETHLRRGRSLGCANDDQWYYLCHAAAMQRNITAVRETLAEDGVAVDRKIDVAFEIFNNLIAQGHNDAALDLCDGLRGDDPLGMVAAFWEACLCHRQGDGGRAANLYGQASMAARRLVAGGTDNATVKAHISSAFNMETDAYIDALSRDGGEGPAFDVPEIEFLDPPGEEGEAGPVFFCSCDAVYFAEYGEAVARSIAGAGLDTVLHINIINPDDGTQAVCDSLRQGDDDLPVRFSIERTREHADAVYYSCSRFMHANAVADHYGRDLIITDIDLDVRPALAGLVGVMADYDVGFFRTGSIFPWLDTDAKVVYRRNSDGGRMFFDILAGFLQAKLGQTKTWTVDQAGIYCVARYVGGAVPDIRVADFSRLYDTPFQDVVVPLGSGEHRRSLRLATAAGPSD